MIYVVCSNEIVASDSEVSYKDKKMLKAFSTKEKAKQYIETLPYLATLDKIAAHIEYISGKEEDDISLSDNFLTAFFYEFLTRNIYVADVREVLFGVIKDSVSNTVDWIRLKAIIMTAVDAFASPFMQEVLEKLGIAPYIIEEALLA